MKANMTGQILVGAVSLAVAAAAIFAVTQRPAVYPDAPTAAVQAALDAGEATPSVLIDQRWGPGRLVVVGSGEVSTRRRLSLSFVGRSRDGWRVVNRASQTADRNDVTVASLLLASSAGSRGQPAWSAAFGEVSNDAIATVEALWSDGSTTQAARTATSYLVVRPGVHAAIKVRYLDASGAEVAVVPVDTPASPAPSAS